MALPTVPSPSVLARPAEPLLASSLLSPPDLDAVWDCFLPPTPSAAYPTPGPEILHTGIDSLDVALGSTLRSGSVVALSAETGTERNDVSKSLLVDCLLRHPEAVVAVVDATGNFDVVGLYARILGRLKQDSGGRGDEEGEAERMLDRVRIMRVFDFVGLSEAVGELREGLEGRRVGKVQDEGGRGDMGDEEKAPTVTEKQPRVFKKTEIADSEDEGSDIEASSDNEEMLFDTLAADPAPSPPQPTRYTPAQDAVQPRLKLVLIDNLSHILSPLLKRDAVAANHLATTFLASLSNLTRTHALHTILLNPCISPRNPSPTRQSASHAPRDQIHAPGPQQQQQQQQQQPHHVSRPAPPPSPSIFSSNDVVPLLLALLARYADSHVLVTMMPRGKMDARVYYAEGGGNERGKRRGVEMVGVVEVVSDRWGGRVGAWGVWREGNGSV